ncbi:hypothetical protein J4461_00370 [Candidatus Pacearchaeota archaeon]|nr:hypothetical protein [Candidatus Pacearchaeota archaeon]
MPQTLEIIASQTGIPIWLIAVIIVWSLAWKGVAWWISARKNHILWFLSFFLINTLGILEILYIFLFSKMSLSDKSVKRKSKKRK